MSRVYGLDFDGTVVKFAYPEIGEEVPHALRVLKRILENGDHIVLNTMRGQGSGLKEAGQWLVDNGIKLIGLNYNPLQSFPTSSGKVYADAYIDDLAIGIDLIKDEEGNQYVDWLHVEKILVERGWLPE